jgi:membrane protease YdiL (CAAX protease family)
VSPEPFTQDRAGQRAFPIILVSVAMLAMLFNTERGLRTPPMVWATWTVICFGCLPMAAGLALDGWGRVRARIWATMALVAALAPAVTIAWTSGGKAWLTARPRVLLLAVALNAGALIMGGLHGGVDLRRWGLGWGDWRWWLPRTGLAILGCAALVAGWFAVDPAMAAYYPSDAMAKESLGGLLAFCAILAFYMVGWESFWRGSLLFGLARCWGPLPAILFGGLPFFLLHRGKPQTEMVGSFVVGCLLSWFCYRGRSLWPGVILHAVLNLSVQLAGYLALG